MSDPTLTGTVDMMEWQMYRSIDLVDDSRDARPISHETRQLQRRSVVLMEALEQAVEASRPVIEAHGHQLVYHCNDDRLAVEGDPVRLGQIMTNLLSDCAKRTDLGGTISLTAERDRSDAVISVCESGIGISPEYLEDVFEMLSHVKVQQTRAHADPPIDLAPVRRLAQMHGGSVSTYSRGIGTGSTLTVRLPAL